MSDLIPRGSFTQLNWGHGKQNALETATHEGHTGHALGGIEGELQAKIGNLQVLICELLLKNQQLRTALGDKTATSLQQARTVDN